MASYINNSVEILKHPNICSPIITLEEAWNFIENPPKWIDSVIELLPRSTAVIKNTDLECHMKKENFGPVTRLHSNSVPRTLVCHDMKGGYLEDRFIGPVYKGNGYTFYRWSQIDIFVYFSHHLITIPPLSWINVAHRNGVKILGTFITEWEPGKIICEEILKSPETVQKFASILADICVLFKIDGWLLNIENSVSKTGHLIEFIKYLTKIVHRRRPGSLIIWYDSVTEEGKLVWQNELNDLNRCFFDACDGIFLNYTWKESNLQETVKSAKHRNLDVYVGVDVFGRNFYGGGKFNTFLAAEKIREFNLSMAIFAQGWTHETLVEEPKNTFMERFLNRDNAFWRSLWPYLYTHPTVSSFHTNFYCGSDTEYFKLNSQELQLTHCLYNKDEDPEFSSIPLLAKRCNCLTMDFDGKYPLCVISKAYLETEDYYIHHLLACDIQINNDIIIYSYTKTVDNNPDSLSLILLVQNENDSYKEIICHSEKQEVLQDNMTLTELNPTDNGSILEKIEKMYKHPSEWKLRCFVVQLYGCKILRIGAMVLKGHSVCLCGIGITSGLSS